MSATASNVVLIGNMSSGKSAVGRELATLLGCGLVETDDIAERLAGHTIPDVFAARGEEGFRQYEAQAVKALAGIRTTVIATGGGTPLSQANWRRLALLGPIVCLRAGAEILARRTGDGQDGRARPLLAGLGEAALVARIAGLQAAREPVYGRADLTVDTTAITPAGAAEKISAWLKHHGWRDAASEHSPASGRPGEAETQAEDSVGRVLGYPVVAEAGALGRWPAAAGWGGVHAQGGGRLPPARRRALLVTDALVGSLWAPQVQTAAERAGLDMAVIHVPRGEQAKTLRQAQRIYRAMLSHALGRDGLVVALGGGSVGDVAGYAAATYMRGVQYVQLPTTLLAQVDSAVGGKTAVDIDGHKNTVGVFWNPSAVIADVELLETLPLREIRSGLAEVLKYGLIQDAGLWLEATSWGERLQAASGPTYGHRLPPGLGLIVQRCLAHKAAVVAGDPLDRGSREALNFGHTVGHALEAAAAGRLRHGEAVALGMDFAAVAGECLGVTAQRTAEAIRQGLRRCGLWPRRPHLPPQDTVLDLVRRDKKTRASQSRLVLLRRLGQVLPEPIALEITQLRDLLVEWQATLTRKES